MIGPRWHKVLADLWGNKLRTLLVVASIAIGVFNVGLIVALSTLILEDMTTSYLASEPSHAVVYADGFQEDFLTTAERVKGVRAADSRRSANVKVLTESGDWIPLGLEVVRDFEDMRMDRIVPLEGKWPPGENEILIEAASMPTAGKQVGEWLEIELADGSRRLGRLAGTAWSETSGPGSPTNVNGFVGFETLEWLHEDSEYTRLDLDRRRRRRGRRAYQRK